MAACRAELDLMGLSEYSNTLEDNDLDKKLDILRQLAYCQVLEREGYWTGLARVTDMTMDYVHKEIRGEVK